MCTLCWPGLWTATAYVADVLHSGYDSNMQLHTFVLSAISCTLSSVAPTWLLRCCFMCVRGRTLLCAVASHAPSDWADPGRCNGSVKLTWIKTWGMCAICTTRYCLCFLAAGTIQAGGCHLPLKIPGKGVWQPAVHTV